MKTKNKTNIEVHTRKYTSIAEKFQNNVTLSKDEINFMISFRRDLSCK